MKNDPRMQGMGASTPFDGKRLIYRGLAPILDAGRGGRAGYVDGYIAAVPEANRDTYRAVAAEAVAGFERLSALRTVDLAFLLVLPPLSRRRSSRVGTGATSSCSRCSRPSSSATRSSTGRGPAATTPHKASASGSGSAPGS
jgi:hypothetical protein